MARVNACILMHPYASLCKLLYIPKRRGSCVPTEAATVVKGAVSRGDIWSSVTIEMGNGLDGNTSINLNSDQRRRETAHGR